VQRLLDEVAQALEAIAQDQRRGNFPSTPCSYASSVEPFM
jgi:hypothetical protein